MEKIISDLQSFVLKEGDAPCSALTHLYQALFVAIEELPDEEVKKIPLDGMGADAILEMCNLGKPKSSDRYAHFFTAHDVEREILKILKWKPRTIDALVSDLRGKYTERDVKESVLRLRERGLITPNDQWEMTITL